MRPNLTPDEEQHLDTLMNTVQMSAILRYMSKVTYEAADSVNDEGNQHLQQTAATIRAAALFCEEWERV